ncbi:MAG: HAMP domain-containing histidine kinase [Clostridium butyricum]|nr:HAMP domain-containing histidine kinase [Clostridium butyricum]
MKKDYSLCFIFVISILCIGFSIYSYLKYNNRNFSFDIICFSILLLLIFICYYMYINRYVNNILEKLNLLINNIIDKKEDEIFSTLNDDLLSKLQNNTIKLINILKAENEREHKSKNEIQSLISDISHQLKTPCTNLKMYFEFLKNEDLSSEERREFIDILDIQTQRLNFLIESMIKMSRLESNLINLKVKNTNLSDVCLMAIRQVYENARKKNIEIKFVAKDDINIFVDEKWSAEAIFNILDNAVKYTSSGGVIKVSLNEYDLFCMAEIKDTGMGIEKEDINNIFKRFYRGKNTDNINGVGIGLFLANEIITKEKGFIKVKSEKGVGSTFSVMLPIRNSN